MFKRDAGLPAEVVEAGTLCVNIDVADAVEVGGHDAMVVVTILAVIAFAEFDACNFGVRLVQVER